MKSSYRTQICFWWPGLGLLLISMLGCGLVKKAYEPNPKAAPVVPIMPVANPVPHPVSTDNGSLWSADQSVNPFSDDKAFRKGDILLVHVIQRNTGSKKANTDTSRQSSIQANIKYALGLEKSINKLTENTSKASAAANSGTAGASASNDLINASSSNAFKGDASTARDDSLEATVSTLVTDVLNNGNLVIYGSQTVQLNNESSVLTVQGIVRPSDIGADNMLESTRIANASIQFTGSGVLSDKQHPGWATRIFDWVSPF